MNVCLCVLMCLCVFGLQWLTHEGRLEELELWKFHLHVAISQLNGEYRGTHQDARALYVQQQGGGAEGGAVPGWGIPASGPPEVPDAIPPQGPPPPPEPRDQPAPPPVVEDNRRRGGLLSLLALRFHNPHGT